VKILQVVLHDGIGGMETLARGLDAEFRRLSHEARIHFLDPRLNAGSRTGRISRLRSLRSALRDFRPDVAVAHSALPNVYTRIAAVRRTPVITVLHSAQDDFINLRLRLAEKVLAKQTARVVAVSPLSRQQYVQHFPSMTPYSIVIPNGIPSDIAMREEKSSEPIRMVAVSRLVPQKRIDLLVNSFAHLLRDTSLPPLSLDIIGGGSESYVQHLNAQIFADEHLTRCVRLLGQRNDVDTALSQYDLFVHPSQRENHSIAILEAAAAGLPAVMSDIVASAVDPHVVKVEFSTDNAVSLEAGMRSAITDLDTFQHRASNAAATIRETYNLQNCALHYLRLCEAVTIIGERS
jgi:glycosyltransferase involved in cell wall biosynthesis